MSFWNNFAIERDRWPLWLPVALGAGSGAYFALPAEPPVLFAWIALGLTWAAATLGILGRARWRFAFVWALLAALLLGFGLAKLRETRIRTPVLERGSVMHLTGRLVSLEPREKGVRAVLEDVRSGGLILCRAGCGSRCAQARIFSPAIGSASPRGWTPRPAPASRAPTIWGAASIFDPSARWVLPMAGLIPCRLRISPASANAPAMRWKDCALA